MIEYPALHTKSFLQINHIHQLLAILIDRMVIVVSKEILYPVRNRETTVFIKKDLEEGTSPVPTNISEHFP